MTSRNNHHRSASPRFQSIKAVFEQADALTPPAPRSFPRPSSPSPRLPTDETPNPVSNLISRETSRDQQETIDTLLEASTNHHWPTSRGDQQLRPKASWIGPPPPSRLPSSSNGTFTTMAHKVTIKYSSPGLQPPVYITTSLSDPQWDLLEMDCGELPGGEREFVKTFHADEGEYQYKFRLGPGDWWVCDEGMPTLDDGLGNRNNVLVVKDGVSAKKTAAHPQCLAEDDDDDDAASSELERVPTLPHERDSSERNPKRDSLGDDVVGDKLAQDVKTEASDDHQAPLLPHEQNGTPNRRVGVQPEDVPVDFSADDEDGDVEPSHYPQSPIFAHERDVPARVPTPGTDEDEDYMEEAPLMRHETLSPEPSERHHAPRLAHEKDDHHDAHDSDVLLSPVSPTSSAHFPVSRDHIPAEADPNDPSLERLPTHQEGILESLRRSSMRMSKDEALQDVITSTSPVTKTMSHASSQSPSLPSVLEDEEEPEDEALSHDGSKPAVDSHALPTSSARPAALMTPPRTPDESKLPDVAGHHLSNHHHKAVAERDMLEEATHGVSHHGSDQNKSVDHQTDAVGITEASAASKDTSKPASKPNTQAKSNGFFGGFFQSALGLGLTVLLGAGAAWLAFRMSDTIKDGGATLTS